MVRKATANDAGQLSVLNDEFNGAGGTTLDSIRNSLLYNQQEIVIVDDEHGILTGFVCVQLKRSFCYDKYSAEITEVYVRPEYRERGIAGQMISFAEDYCSRNYPLHKYELLTETENVISQSLYAKLGYSADGELHLSKQIKK
ncbi:MAG: GNAT family N-acetyltransferase [Clostridia bacterium]|nr:GNAT family N-acetyltransferase [Clostridia bacterium]